MKKPVLILTFLATSLFASAQTSNYANGSTVADFTVTDINGVTHSLYSYTSQGKYVVLDFFFAGCGPCQATAPYFNQLHETYGCNSADLVCLTINNGNDNDAQVLAYENTYGGTYAHSPAVSNTGGGPAVTSTFGVGAFPTYCLIGPDNKMVKNDMWPIGSMQSFVNYLPAAIQPAACATSVPEINTSRTISIHPSPSTGAVTVELEGMGSGNVTMELFDMLGQQVRTLSLGGATSGALRQNVDLSDLGNGQYLCRFITNDGRRDVRRLVIAH